MNALEELKRSVPAIEKKIGYFFIDKDFLVLSFVHRSFVNENKSFAQAHNERLEFLGDAVLGLIATDFLYNRLPEAPEGLLSQLRSRLVDASACAHYVQKLFLADFIVLGRGEKRSEGKAKTSILADVFEALIGAIYLDGGLPAAKTFLLDHFMEDMAAAIESPSSNYKAELQDYSQKKFQKAPVYKVIEESGPDHAKIFHVLVFINDEEAGSGRGASKKEAEQQAACDALARLKP